METVVFITGQEEVFWNKIKTVEWQGHRKLFLQLVRNGLVVVKNRHAGDGQTDLLADECYELKTHLKNAFSKQLVTLVIMQLYGRKGQPV